ncbi:MAG: hypothetical protein KC492_07660, partial [Myxococcales bacterium]|nr:hypothetical protein [Myxococcales bacterium]
DAWTRWSEAQGAPSPKPAFQLSTHWASSVESSLPVPAANPVFEQGRVDGRVAMADVALRKILETERKRGTVGLAPFAKELNEPEVSWPAEVLAKLQLAEATDDGKAEVVARIVERPVGFLPKSYAAERVFWLSEEGERCDAKLPYFRQRSLKADPQGKRLLAASTGRYGGEAYCLDLESGEHTSWYRDPPYYYGKGNLELHDVAWLEGGRSFAVALDKSLRIFEAAPTDPLNPVEVANQKVRVTRLQSARNGSVLIACGEKDVCVFALDRKRKLKKLAKWKLEAWGARELEDGRVIFRHRYKGPWYEVTDLDTALAELNPAPKRKAKERAV